MNKRTTVKGKIKINTAAFNLKLNPQLYAKAQALAAHHGKQMSTLVTQLLEEWLREEAANPGCSEIASAPIARAAHPDSQPDHPELESLKHIAKRTVTKPIK